jgi:hypothetical protein
MCHETRSGLAMLISQYGIHGTLLTPAVFDTYFVIRSSIDRGSRIKVGKTTRLRSAPGRSWEIMWVRTVAKHRLVRERSARIYTIGRR